MTGTLVAMTKVSITGAVCAVVGLAVGGLVGFLAASPPAAPERLGDQIELQWPDDLDTALTECAQDHEDSAYALVPLDRQADGLTVNWGDVECYAGQ